MRKALQLKIVVALMLFTSIAWSQTRTVTGKVTSSEDGSAVPGVNVVVKGTTNGTTTDADGNFSLVVPNEGGTMIFSFIGLGTQEAVIGDRTVVDVQMENDARQLSEVVVTAQNISKEKKSLGYAVQTVNGSDVAQRSETNLLNSLQGKLSGVVISGSGGGAGSSTNINIRGVTSLGGNNQPLIVVDGIIFNNDVNNTQNTLFGSQPSNRLNDISPENIASINVLKGPGAAVLYGSRASSGVIVITTKQGSSKQVGKTEVTLTSSLNFQNAYGLPKFQNQYGQGVNNDFNNTSSNSWGPAFGGSLQNVVRIQGDTVPYQAYPNNVSDFYKTGKIFQNGVNIASGNKDKNVSMSISNTTQDGIIPGTSYKRNSIQLGGTTKLDNGLKVGASATYVQSIQTGITQGNGGSALGQMTRIPRSYNLIGSPFETPLGTSIYYNPAQNNPLWSTKYETFTSTVDRLFGFVTLGYDIKPWLNVTYRATTDVFFDRRKQSLAIGSARSPTGDITEDAITNSELNGDLMIRANKENIFIEGLSASLLLGQNINQRKFQDITTDAASLTIPGFQNVSNGSVFTGSAETHNVRRLVGYYGDLSLSYKNYLFVTLQGRVDQSSTLPKANNTYFYPGVSVSFVPSDAFDFKSNLLSAVKIRASAAKVGKDANPYLLSSVYIPSSFGNNVASITFPIAVGGSIPGFIPSSRIGSNQLSPEFTTSYDGGVNVGLFNGKLNFDLGYFYSESSKQIFNVAVSNSSGFDTRTTNVGLITNRGWEFELSAAVLRRGAFTWDIAGNWTRLRNEVVHITPGITSSTIPGNTFGGISPSIKEGSPYGVIIGTDFAKSPSGDRLINPTTGQYAAGTPNMVIANPNPDWLAGLTNTFTYKNISLMTLFDVRYGGDVYSFGWTDLKQNGSLAVTAVDRDQPRILPGVIDVNGDGSVYVPNNIQISAQTFWGQGGLASKSAVFNATTYRWRELTVTYRLPAKWLAKTPLGSASIGFSGRNLLFYAPYAPGDPAVNTQGAGNIQGLDLNGAPATRNYGFNIRITL